MKASIRGTDPQRQASERESMIEDYDVIVIGGGPGGEVAAERCSHAGLSSTAIENYDSFEEGQ